MCFSEGSAHDPLCDGRGNTGLGGGGRVDCPGLSHPMSAGPEKQGQVTQGRAQPSLAVLMGYASLSDMTGAGMTTPDLDGRSARRGAA
jgi:hypothetical protein